MYGRQQRVHRSLTKSCFVEAERIICDGTKYVKLCSVTTRADLWQSCLRLIGCTPAADAYRPLGPISSNIKAISCISSHRINTVLHSFLLPLHYKTGCDMYGAELGSFRDVCDPKRKVSTSRSPSREGVSMAKIEPMETCSTVLQRLHSEMNPHCRFSTVTTHSSSMINLLDLAFSMMPQHVTRQSGDCSLPCVYATAYTGRCWFQILTCDTV
jgi:hypothetical protein